jgi:sugar O-acyltransferase (sialic acid O-acetyltransferase NeuD family)
MKKKLVIIGSGGHFNSVIDILEKSNDFKILGIIDKDKKKIGKSYFNHMVLGNDSNLREYKKKTDYVFLAVGLIKNYKERLKLINLLIKIKFKFPNFFSKTSVISKSLNYGQGNIVMKQALINNNVSLGNFNIINNKSLIEHDVTIGSNVHISTGVIINGDVKIGSNVFIGSGSIITNKKIIKSNSFIKAGTII